QVQKHAPAFESEVVDAWQGNGDAPERSLMETEIRTNARDAIDQAMLTLNEQQREIVILFHNQNWPISSIAEHLDMPEGTIKSHLHRARKRMKQAMTADEEQLRRLEEVWQ